MGLLGVELRLSSALSFGSFSGLCVVFGGSGLHGSPGSAFPIWNRCPSWPGHWCAGLNGISLGVVEARRFLVVRF